MNRSNSTQRTLLPQLEKASTSRGLIGVDYFPPPSTIVGTQAPNKMFDYLMSKEEDRVRETYLNYHEDLKPVMRSKLSDWLLEVSHEYSLKRITTQLSLIFVDKYLSMTRDFPLESLQLLGITSLVVASKLEEIYPPAVSEFAVTTDGLCSTEDIIGMEKLILQVLGWDLFPMTYFHWVEFLLFNVFHQTDKNSNYADVSCRDIRLLQVREKRTCRVREKHVFLISFSTILPPQVPLLRLWC